MIRIAVREHDMDDVSRAISQASDLPRRGKLFLKLKAGGVDHRSPNALRRARDVVKSDAGIYQRQPTGVLDQHAMTRRSWVRRSVQKTAVEMMDLHQVRRVYARSGRDAPIFRDRAAFGNQRELSR